VISPILANLFLHYAFDMWMARTWSAVPFERYADDAICHCRTREEAEALQVALQERFAACRLVLHADSDEVARVHRSHAARRSNLMPPTIPI
jgi:retron-type reverse transcriptase